MSLLFDNIHFINENTKRSNTEKLPCVYNEKANYIHNCTFAISEELIEEYGDNTEVLEEAALIEGAKIDFAIANWLNEGKDYRNLKKELRQIIKANDLDDDELRTGQKGFMHVCKRILQVLYDLLYTFNLGSAVGATISGTLMGFPSITILITILYFVIGFITNRLLRLAVDTIEFNSVKKDSEDIIDDLRAAAKKCNNEKHAKHLNKEADKLEEAVKKYSKKNKDKDND